jgi:hypothetical protein
MTTFNEGSLPTLVNCRSFPFFDVRVGVFHCIYECVNGREQVSLVPHHFHSSSPPAAQHYSLISQFRVLVTTNIHLSLINCAIRSPLPLLIMSVHCTFQQLNKSIYTL